MADKFEKALYQDVVDKFGEENALNIFEKLSEIKNSGGEEAHRKAIESLTGHIQESVPKTAEQKIAETMANRKTYNVGDKMVTRGSGYTEKIDNVMKGAGGTEKIGGHMKLGNTQDVLDKVDDFRKAKAASKVGALSKIAGEAEELAGDKIFGKAGKLAGKAGKVAGKAGKVAGKVAGKIPGLGALLGPLVVLAMTGNPNEALASGLGSENLGEGSDEAGDMGLSMADLRQAERKGIDAQEKREDEPEDMSEQLKFLKGGQDAPDQEEQLRGKRRKFGVLGE